MYLFRLVEDYGHDIHVLAVNYKGDHVDTNLKLYNPTKLVEKDAYGQSRIVEMLANVEPEVVVMLNDPHVVRKILHRNNWDTDKILLRYRPLLAYMPVDGTNFPTLWNDLEETTQPVLMSFWGKTWLKDAPVVYHGVDTEQFRPPEVKPFLSSGGMKVRNKREAKEALGYDPDKFLVVRVDRNSTRKNFGDTWKALLPVMRKHKDIIAHFHCKSTGDLGVELPQLFSREPDLADRFFVPGQHNTHQGWPIDDLAILYAAGDLFVSTTWAEGFGLTLAESIASEVPVVATDCSSITEVVGPGGVLIPPKGHVVATPGQDQWLPDIPAFSEAIEDLYLDEPKRKALGKAGRAHVKEKFSWDVAAQQFDQLIRDLAATVEEDE